MQIPIAAKAAPTAPPTEPLDFVGASVGATLSEAAILSLAKQWRKRTRLSLHRRAPLGVHDAVAIKI